jgi:hypothetical protein
MKKNCLIDFQLLLNEKTFEININWKTRFKIASIVLGPLLLDELDAMVIFFNLFAKLRLPLEWT